MEKYFAKGKNENGKEVGLEVDNNGLLNCSYMNLIGLKSNATVVYCRNNQLTSLELPNATVVDCRNNQLTSLELPNATTVDCDNNQLTSLELPNATTVDCDNLTLKFNGKEVSIKYIDGYSMIILSTRNKGDFEIISAKYLSCEDKHCIIANRGDFYAHGDTVKEAINDVNFKFLQENSDVSEISKSVFYKGVVTVNDYRLLTGACSQGVRHFLKENKITKDSLPLEKVKKITVGHYGHESFMKHLSQFS